MKKIVILDSASLHTYVIPYDPNVYDSPEECIEEYLEDNNIQVSSSDCQFMVVDRFKLTVL